MMRRRVMTTITKNSFADETTSKDTYIETDIDTEKSLIQQPHDYAATAFAFLFQFISHKKSTLSLNEKEKDRNNK